MAFLSSLDIAGSGLTATRLRMDVIAENMDNVKTTRTADGGPYRRKQVVYQAMGESDFNTIFKSKLAEKSQETQRGVRVVEIVEDRSDFTPVYDPEHPDANAEGYVMMPNVDPVKETLDMMVATRAYDLNLTALNGIKLMAAKALEIGR